MPRFKSVHSKKLHRPDTGIAAVYENLQSILTKPIKWDLIRKQYEI
jgi:TnpA family transposase